MQPSSQHGRPKPHRQTISSQSYSQFSGSNGNIKDFFKPFTIPKNRIPINAVVEDEIVVASPRARSRSPSGSIVSGRNGSSTTPTPSPPPARKSRSLLKAKHANSLDGVEEDDLHHESPPESQQRVMSAMQVPTPMKSQAVLVETTKKVGTTRRQITSFDSMSSFTSVPLSSQASSSRRIVRDGVPVVTNSNSGSEEEELEDIVFQPRKRVRMTPPLLAESEERSGSTAKRVTRQSGGQPRRRAPASNASNTPGRRASPEPASMNSLVRLVREKEKREGEEAELRRGEAAFEEEQKRREEKLHRERDLGGGLKALVADDSDEGERMMLAMERTEALEDEEEFFYFRGIRQDSSEWDLKASNITAFAPWSHPRFERLKRMVLDERAREQACLSGMLAEVADKYALPPELMDWMFGRLAWEKREDLCEAYVEVLRLSLRRGDAATALEYASLSRVYHTEEELVIRDQSDHQRNSVSDEGTPSGLQHVLRVVQYACTSHEGNAYSSQFLQLVLASVDIQLSRNTALQSQLQECLAAIIDHTSAADIGRLAHAIDSSPFTSVTLRRCIIAMLPAFTEQCHGLRRMLALHLLTDRPIPNPAKQATTPEDHHPKWADLILTRLRSAPAWSISESTNYLQLNALIPVLDIAIDAGFSSDSGLLPPKQPQDNDFPPKPKSHEEAAFNARIDALTDQLRLLSSRIRDAGASHLRRTEAKSALERLIVRLEHCVRTRPRRRKGVFGGGGDLVDRQRRVWSGFLLPRGKEGGNVLDGDGDDGVSVVAAALLTDREESDGDGDTEGGAEDKVEDALNVF